MAETQGLRGKSASKVLSLLRVSLRCNIGVPHSWLAHWRKNIIIIMPLTCSLNFDLILLGDSIGLPLELASNYLSICSSHNRSARARSGARGRIGSGFGTQGEQGRPNRTGLSTGRCDHWFLSYILNCN